MSLIIARTENLYMTNPASDRLLFWGNAIDSAAPSEAEALMVKSLGDAIRFPFQCSSGRLVDSSGEVSSSFACVVHTARNDRPAALNQELPADNACAVVDLVEELGLEELRAAHQRCLFVKKLARTDIPDVGPTPVAVGTMCIIFARRAKVPIDVLAEEFCRLNGGLDHSDWIDMVAISATAVISYGCQFAGRRDLGGLMPPSKGARDRYSPAWYIIPTMQATGPGTFNKVASFIAAYTVFFSPGTLVPEYQDMQVGVGSTVITLPAYQYNLAGDLRPVPPEHYVGRLLPSRPFLVQAMKSKELLATLTYIPWQDGGVILLRGKLPLEGLLVFLGRDALLRGGVVRSGPQSQDSYVLPITQMDFQAMMDRLRNQSNMAVRQVQTKYVMEKMADEETTTPFMARVFMGILQLRDTAFPDEKDRQGFDRTLDEALTPLMSARTAANEIRTLWDMHREDIASGRAVRIRDGGFEVVGNFHGTFRREVDSFLYDAAKTLKEGAQKAGRAAGKDIGFLFQKQDAFEKGLEILKHCDPTLATYLEETRSRWSERLINARNALDHGGWTLPKTRYEARNGSQIVAHQPMIDGTPAVEFVTRMFDRLSCFLEEFLAHCFQARLPAGAEISEVPLLSRDPQAPQRFRLTLRVGGVRAWHLVYSDDSFDEV